MISERRAIVVRRRDRLAGMRSWPSKEKRIIPACEGCRRRKVKCDGATPSCTTCAPLNLNCVPPTVRYKDSALKQPESTPHSQEQLAAEVKSIYAGLVLVEAKCIDADREAVSERTTELSKDHWQALTVLHRTLLHEHRDFFLASQHPTASPALRRLAMEYNMPARMWEHGVHSFLNLLRQSLWSICALSSMSRIR